MRRTFTAEEKASVFELWKNGTGFSEIANIPGSKPGTIFTMLRDTGGIKPHERKRAVAHLTLSEREEIRAGLSAKMSIRAIATALNRSPSTISREVLNRPGFPESVLSVNSGCQIIVSDGSIISFFCFCRRSMAQPFQQSSIVIPVHPRECGQFHFCTVSPALTVYYLRFVKTIDALRHRVVIRVACTSC